LLGPYATGGMSSSITLTLALPMVLLKALTMQFAISFIGLLAMLSARGVY